MIEDVKKVLQSYDLADLRPMSTFDVFQQTINRIKQEITKDRKARSATIKKKSWVCGHEHKIVHYKSGKKRINKHLGAKKVAPASKSNFEIDERESLCCTHCNSKWNPQSDKQGFSSCVHGCDVYLCDKCGVCKNNHPIEYFVGQPKDPAYTYGGARCDLCRVEMAYAAWNEGYFRCNQCNYEVCNRCVPKPKNMISPITKSEEAR